MLGLGDALVLIDVQNDFLPGGAVPVPRADEIVPVLNDYLARFSSRKLPIFLTRDWHPENHCSFHAQSGEWPRHCVVHSTGAEFPSALRLPALATTLPKGTDPLRNAQSGFDGTELETHLRERGVHRLFIGGLATEYGVLHTVRDALRRGFHVHLLADAIRAVDLGAHDGVNAEAEMVRLGAVPTTLADLKPLAATTSALLIDQDQLTMLRGYFAANMHERAVFEFFVCRLPPDWNFLIAAGLEQALDFLENFRFTPADAEWISSALGFTPDDAHRIAGLRFTGDVHAMAEGTIFFPDEPILRVTAPITEAQIVETRLVNLLHFQTLIASKAVRSTLVANNLVDFGLRRAHGAEAALLAARACFLAGFSATSDVLAGQEFGIPISGTMAHSFVEACDSEEEAFLRFARANRGNVALLLDTYDTEAAAHKVVALAPTLRGEGIAIRGVRLDSGDLAEHARQVRKILDAGGLRNVQIFASSNLDEHELQRHVSAGAPIDGYGVGSRVITSADAPYLDCAYNLQEYAGTPRGKLSEGKVTWPGTKQVYRHLDPAGRMAFDLVALAEETQTGTPLLECVMHRGRRTRPSPELPAVRAHAQQQLALLSAGLRGLAAGERHAVLHSQRLQALAAQLRASHGPGPGRSGPISAPPSSRWLHRLHASDPAVGDGGAPLS